MKHDKIIAAYDKAAPSLATEVRILYRVLNGSPEEKAVRRRPLLRRALAAAACVALLAALVGAGYAAYEKWRLPAPEPYTPDPDHYNVQVHEEHTYAPQSSETAPEEPGSTATAPAVTEPEPLSDAFFLQRAKAVLIQAGIEPDEDATVTVRRQKNLYWDREEVEVSWPKEGMPISVSFDAEQGVFIGMVGIDWVLSDAAACSTQAEADALARRYYESLPVEQGYVLASCEKYDEQFWSYDFCREVEPGLYSWYECVRVAINPVSGGLEFCKVFYVPLLDDHEPGDVPLTQEEALAIALEKNPYLATIKLELAEKYVALPNWFYSDYDFSLTQKAAGVTRICWRLQFRDDNGIFVTISEMWIDCYTGEILGGA